MRVQRILSMAGVRSRREAEELIKRGLVTVNGRTITLGDQADPDKDKIALRGKPIRPQKTVYLALNKPRGVLSTTKDERGRRTVIDLVKLPQKLILVGRLDLDAEGLIVLTTDGAWAQRIAHPSFEVKKTYDILLARPVTDKQIKELEQGVSIDNRPVRAKLTRLGPKAVQITIHEGRKHIVKRLFEEVGNRVLRLKRVSIGPIRLGQLGPGKWRRLSPKEVSAFS